MSQECLRQRSSTSDCHSLYRPGPLTGHLPQHTAVTPYEKRRMHITAVTGPLWDPDQQKTPGAHDTKLEFAQDTLAELLNQKICFCALNFSVKKITFLFVKKQPNLPQSQSANLKNAHTFSIKKKSSDELF